MVASVGIQADFDRVTLSYQVRDRGSSEHWQFMRYSVRLDWTPCHHGGQRVWWMCSDINCGRRVAVLYGDRTFTCRHCCRLAYRCQREADDDRAAPRADKIRERLGWEPGILNGSGSKPKGMHWRTYWRLLAQHNDAVAQTLAGVGARLGFLHGLLDRV